MIGFCIIFATGLLAAIVGYLLGKMHDNDFSYWLPLAKNLGVQDVQSFVTVAYIHNSSYLGGIIGLLISIIYLRREIRIEQGAAANP